MDEGAPPGPGRVRGLIRQVTAVTLDRPGAAWRRAGHHHARGASPAGRSAGAAPVPSRRGRQGDTITGTHDKPRDLEKRQPA
jgi:hypothetical protein